MDILSTFIKTGYYWQGVGTVYKNEKGQFHREDGPAVERDNGTKEWYINGKLHRIDGPAVACIDSYKEWWVNDRYVFIY